MPLGLGRLFFADGGKANCREQGHFTQYKKAPTLRYVVIVHITTYRKGAPS